MATGSLNAESSKRIKDLVLLCNEGSMIAQNGLESLNSAPDVLFQVFIECSSLEAACRLLSVLDKQGKIPTAICQRLDDAGGVGGVLDACIQALDDFDGLMVEYLGTGDKRRPGLQSQATNLQGVVDSLQIVRHIISLRPAARRPVPDAPVGGLACSSVDYLKNVCYIEQTYDFLKCDRSIDNQESTFVGALKNTGRWFLASQQFTDWAASRGQTLYCPGILGAGKTTMMSIAVNDIRNRYKYRPDFGVAFVYLDDDDSYDEDADWISLILSSLLLQFAGYGARDGERRKDSALVQLYDRHYPHRTTPSHDELFNALQKVMLRFNKTYIFVDSIEFMTPAACAGAREDLVAKLSFLQARHKTNLYYTCRPTLLIERHFAGVPTLEICAADSDIEIYLQTKMRLLPGFIRNNPERRSEVISTIVGHAKGMFLLAKTYVEELKSASTIDDMRDGLDDHPEGISEFRDEELDWIEENHLSDGKLARKALSWIAASPRPLSVAALQHAIAVNVWGDPEFDESMLPCMDDVLEACNGHVLVDKETGLVSLRHWTMEKTMAPGRDDRGTHATESVNYLSYPAFADGPCKTDAEFEERLAKFPFYLHAAKIWAEYESRPYIPQRDPDTSKWQFLGPGKLSPHAEAAFQALYVRKRDESHVGYSQEFPRDMHGLHVAACYGMFRSAKHILDKLLTPPGPFLGPNHPPFSVPGGVQVMPRVPSKLNMLDSEGRSPLWYAAYRADENIVRLLAGSGRFDPKEADLKGVSPLGRALTEEKGVVAGMLLRHCENGDLSPYVMLIPQECEKE